MARIRPGDVHPRADRITTPPPPPGYVAFSYRYLAVTDKFNTRACDAHWFDGLFDRLRALSSLRPQEILSNRSDSLRAHPIEFSRTSEPAGFAHLNDHLREHRPYQFQLSRNTGRVHGFLIGLVFQVVWMDPHHRLYP